MILGNLPAKKGREIVSQNWFVLLGYLQTQIDLFEIVIVPIKERPIILKRSPWTVKYKQMNIL